MKTMIGYPEFSGFENRLIKRVALGLACRFHLSCEDHEDIQQELAVFLWQQKDNYDPEHVSGSMYETYITKCLERKSLEILRSVRPDIEVDDDSVNRDCGSIFVFSFGRAGKPTDLNAFYNLTVSSAFSNLSPLQKELFKQLGGGKSIAAIAAESGITYATTYTRVRRLRKVLKKHGFDLSMN